MMTINYKVLSEVAAAARGNTTWQNLQAFRAAATPEVVLALLDELEQKKWNDALDAALEEDPVPAVPAVLERLRTIVADPRALPRRKEWVSGQQYSYVLLENVEAMVDEACHAASRMQQPDGWEAVAVAWKVTFTQVDHESNTFTAIYFDKAEVEYWVRLHKACGFRVGITPLYAAPPVPDKLPREYIRGWPLAYSDYAEGWNDCRATMLKRKGE